MAAFSALHQLARSSQVSGTYVHCQVTPEWGEEGEEGEEWKEGEEDMSTCITQALG